MKCFHLAPFTKPFTKLSMTASLTEKTIYQTKHVPYKTTKHLHCFTLICMENKEETMNGKETYALVGKLLNHTFMMMTSTLLI